MKQKIRLTELQLAELTDLQNSKDCTTSELKRILAIFLVDDAATNKSIEMLTGYSKKYAFDIRKKYLKRGIDSLKDRKGKKKNLLTKNQREQIMAVLKGSSPRIFGYDNDYWTTSILGQLIKEQYGVDYKSKTSLYIIFKDAKFTYHKPDKQYRNRNKQLIDQWIEKNANVIKEAINDHDTVVLVEDEMFLSTQTTAQKIWLPKGEFPKIDISSKRQIRCIYGFLNVSNGAEYAFKTMRANSEESCKALDSIGKIYKNRKIMIIWDNAVWHKSATVKEFLATTKHKFHLIQLPPYAPELNPQEHVWKSARPNVSHNRFIEDIDKATDEFIEFLHNQIFDYKFFSNH